ncbi:MAG TPA: VWA domain-containing protein [Anaerolineales bacterium]|nr:VWA domain-containing protein [Anaerolineales bacterium]
MTFLWPSALWSLLLAPVFAAAYVRAVRRRDQARAALGALGADVDNMQANLRSRRHVPPALMLLALAVLLFALGRPQAVVRLPRVEGTVILAMDVSNSMLATDLDPSRMEAAKRAARAFVESQPPTILIGVVAFSGGGLTVQAPTDDRQAVLDAIDRLTPQGATSVGEGIFTSLNALAEEPIQIDEASLEAGTPSLEFQDIPSAAVILLTDGENTESPDPLQMAQIAAEAGVRIYAVGIGSPGGAILELEGFRILTQLDETLLQWIAETTNGAYFHAEDEKELQEIYRNIDLQMTIRGETMEVTGIFAGVGLAILLIAGGLGYAWYGRVP